MSKVKFTIFFSKPDPLPGLKSVVLESYRTTDSMSTLPLIGKATLESYLISLSLTFLICLKEDNYISPTSC